MSPSVRPDGRPSKALWKNRSDTGRTAHFRAVGAQRGALTPDVRPVAPTSIGWPIWPVLDRARPCECYATTAHVTAAARAPPVSVVFVMKPTNAVQLQRARGKFHSDMVRFCTVDRESQRLRSKCRGFAVNFQQNRGVFSTEPR